ncbi:hypothetical protein [Sphingomonas sp.]|uniref:hypothetical protein n=1 Tax=Sphingomonas sp. TaxID=28214 RepID=UPI003F6E8CD1
MFGFRKRPKSVEITGFDDEPPQLFTALLCDGFVVRNVPDFAAWIALLRTFQRDHPDVRVLGSLDDVHQSAYTSGHAIETHDLDRIEGLAEQDDYRGYLLRRDQFPIRLANLLARARGVTFASLAGLLPWSTPGDANDPITINADPDAALGWRHEKLFLAQRVPVATAAETVAAWPNGYFVGDLNPMQNLALAQHLETEFGLKLCAIGAGRLAFVSDTPLDAAAAAEAAADIVSLYADAPSDAAERLAAWLGTHDTLLIRYTES